MKDRAVTERTLLDAMRESQTADEKMEWRLLVIERRLDEHDDHWKWVVRGGASMFLAVVADVVLRAS